ncbi:T3SS effector HopA1 family protein [Patescibacteria group bacterium]|nr:T3SS effector HopA1 family protein [Patescibacteria group bacterium]MCL5010248.1 T3SS effector HopA1 family protein [Patescibacteria group bacterium]
MADAAIQELPRQSLETQAFQQAKIRIEKSQRIRGDLQPPEGQAYNRQRVEEVRNIEMRSEQGEEGKRSGFEEILIDTRGYEPKRFRMTYENPQEASISEDLIMYVRMGQNGQPEWLTLQGQPLALNADLYEGRLASHKHAQGTDYKATVMPRVDGQGAYLGITTIIESANSTDATQTKQENQATTLTTPTEARTASQIMDFEQIGNTFQLNEQNPPKPNELITPVVTNMFGENDTPTLAGKAVAKVYEDLITRQGYQRPASAEEAKRIVDAGKIARQDYSDYVKQQLQARLNGGDNRLTFGIDRQSGTDGFHFQGDTNAGRDHLFYFNKSSSHYKNPNEQLTRAYLTLAPNETQALQRCFVDLCLTMYDADIDFSGKCVSPAGLEKRTDDMVLYISTSNQQKASELIKRFMAERGIGKGHVLAAVPSNQDGLSWALEPTQEANAIWREVTGSSKKASFNSFVATMAIPIYLERLALAQVRKGDTAAAQTYIEEAKRVRTVISQHNISDMSLQMLAMKKNTF